jgi:hypothetical protein
MERIGIEPTTFWFKPDSERERADTTHTRDDHEGLLSGSTSGHLDDADGRGED